MQVEWVLEHRSTLALSKVKNAYRRKGRISTNGYLNEFVSRKSDHRSLGQVTMSVDGST